MTNPAAPSPRPDNASLMQSLGLAPPPAPDLGAAATFVSPVLDGSKPFVIVTKEQMATPGVLESLAALEPVLPSFGLTTLPTPDGGGVIFDPTKYDPKTGKTTKPQTTPSPKAQLAAASAPAPTGGNPNTVVGTAAVNAERAKATLPQPSTSPQGGLLGKMITRAY